MISEALLLIAFGYLGLLFIIAAWADRRAKAGRSVIGSALVCQIGELPGGTTPVSASGRRPSPRP